MTIHQLRTIDPDRDDMEPLRQLVLAAFAYMDGVIDPPSSAQRLTVESLREKARCETGYVIERDGVPLACLFAREEPPHTLYIGKFAVSPAYQGKGLGRRLMTEAEHHARARGFSRLRLETRVELVGNHALFRHFGFEKSAENSHEGYDRPTSIEMSKELLNSVNRIQDN